MPLLEITQEVFHAGLWHEGKWLTDVTGFLNRNVRPTQGTFDVTMDEAELLWFRIERNNSFKLFTLTGPMTIGFRDGFHHKGLVRFEFYENDT